MIAGSDRTPSGCFVVSSAKIRRSFAFARCSKRDESVKESGKLARSHEKAENEGAGFDSPRLHDEKLRDFAPVVMPGRTSFRRLSGSPGRHERRARFWRGFLRGLILGNLVGLPIAAAFLIAWWLR